MPSGDNNRKLSDSDVTKMVSLYQSRREDGRWYSTADLASIFKITDTAIIYHLRKRGVTIRSNSTAHLGWNSKPVTRVPNGLPPLCKCGCGQRVEWEQRKDRWYQFVKGHYRRDAPYKNRDWLYAAYVTQMRSVKEIADECGVNQNAVIKFMDKFGIARRPISDSLIVRDSVRGEKNPAWKGGVAKWLYAFNWKRIAKQIRKRDNYTCQICFESFPHSSKVLHVHHIDGDKTNNSLTNLVCVCASCHPLGKRAEREYAESLR